MPPDFGFNGVHSLARHSQLLREIALRLPVAMSLSIAAPN
jgi:hypothetical protein